MPTLAEIRATAKENGLRGHTTATQEELLVMLEHGESRAKARKRLSQQRQETTQAPAPTSRAETASREPARAETASRETASWEPESSRAEPAEESQSQKKTKPPNRWNAWLAQYRKEHNCSMKEAMQHKDEYHKYKEKLRAEAERLP